MDDPDDYIQGYSSQGWEHIGALDTLNHEDFRIGKEEMAKHSLIIAGITRDNATEIPTMIKYIEKTGSFFKDYRVIIFENDSKDKTKELLENWQDENSKVLLVSESFANEKRPSIGFLATVRNKYIHEMIKSEYDSFDIAMMVDMDMTYGWDMRGLFDSFKKISKWDAICSNGIYKRQGNMWDMFAFRNEEFKEDLKDPNYWSVIVPKGQKIYRVDDSLISVDSCFGGLAFYKREFIKKCEYASLEGDCEHVPFHKCLKEYGGSMFMNPAQVIRYTHYK
jgi:hypothetical protein